jgi:hypothetical protein
LSSLIPYGDSYAAYTYRVLFLVRTVANLPNGLETAVEGGPVGRRVFRKAFQPDVAEQAIEGGAVEAGEQYFADAGGMGRQATAHF